MADTPKESTTYTATEKEKEVIERVLKDFTTGRSVLNKGYNYFNGRNLGECIDDWTKRWNGYIPAASPLLDQTQSQIFLNYTRNAIIAYLSKVALGTPKPKIVAVNKKNNVTNKRFAEVLSDLNKYSLNEENGDARFLEVCLETTTKGTAITYEGYAQVEQETEVPIQFNALTGELEKEKKKHIVFDNCFQRIVPLEDFYISNPYQPDVQKQPFVIWREITSYDEAKADFGHYKNFEYVVKGGYTVAAEMSTFYKGQKLTDLGKDQVEILRRYSRSRNQHEILINGVVIYAGPIPFKNGKVPFAKAIFEPFAVDFFWGAGFPNKIMGEQDLKNTFWNMMVDKTEGSLLPYGLTSDLDDIIEDEILAPNKIRKVGDINKWKFDTLPGVTGGEISMLQQLDQYIATNSGDATGSGGSATPRGGKVSARQVLMKQQEAMQRLGFSVNFLEDHERDRTDLRISHILQFYAIPKIEKITGAKKDELDKLIFRDIVLPNEKLSDGRVGNKVIKLTDSLDEAQRTKMADHLSVVEMMGEHTGIPTEALAVQVESFGDYNFGIQIVKNSSYEKNQVLDQSSRMEFAQWRLGLAQAAPVNAPEMIKWVEEAFDIDSERFEGQPGPQQDKTAMAAQGNPGGGQGSKPLAELQRTDPQSALANATG